MDGALASALPQPEAWFHSHVFPDGEAVHGVKPLKVLRKEADVVFEHGVAGKSVLDIGARDGWFSFEAERRGASRVFATELFWGPGAGWGTKAAFDFAHARYRSRVESRMMDLHDISTENPGVFDTVLLLGVLYHLKDPLVGLEHAASVTGETLVVETVTAFDPFPWKMAGYFEGDEFAGDASNFWAPNRRCLEAMLRDVGFKHIRTVRNPNVVPNWRQPELYWRHSRVITHAHRTGAA